jgi:hypothetical protein
VCGPFVCIKEFQTIRGVLIFRIKKLEVEIANPLIAEALLDAAIRHSVSLSPPPLYGEGKEILKPIFPALSKPLSKQPALPFSIQKLKLYYSRFRKFGEE